MAHMYFKGIALNNPSNDILIINLGNNHMFLLLKISHLENGFIHLASVEIQKRKHFEYVANKKSTEVFIHSGDSFNISFVNELVVISIQDATSCKNIDLVTIDTKNKRIVYCTNEEEDF